VFRSEAAIIEEALQSEKKEKSALDSNIQDLRKELAEAKIDLDKERRLAQNIGTQVSEMKDKLKAAEDASVVLLDKNTNLLASLETKDSQLKDLSTEKSKTEGDLAALQETFSKQQIELEQVRLLRRYIRLDGLRHRASPKLRSSRIPSEIWSSSDRRWLRSS